MSTPQSINRLLTAFTLRYTFSMDTLPVNLQRWDSKRRTRAAYDLLAHHYGEPTWNAAEAAQEPMVARLIRVVVAQNTSRSNRALALDRLHRRFPDPALIVEASLMDIVDAIHPAGLANVKAPRLQQMMQMLLDATDGTLDLDFLRSDPLDEAMTFLTSLPGIGQLSASLVMMFGVGRPILPVNTGLLRVATRVGMVPPNTSADRAHDLLPTALDSDQLYAFHLNMVQLARDDCRASRPRCDGCPLAPICLWVHGTDLAKG